MDLGRDTKCRQRDTQDVTKAGAGTGGPDSNDTCLDRGRPLPRPQRMPVEEREARTSLPSESCNP